MIVSKLKAMISKEIRAIPLGTTRDSFGYPLTFKDSKGYWEKYTRDSFGNTLTYKNSNGYWYKYTLDSFGKPLTFENSRGYWSKYTWDSFGNPLTFEDSVGISKVFLGESDSYELWYYLNTSLYQAGCFKGTYQEAMNRWNTPERTDDRALHFTLCIQMHRDFLVKD
jgi:hypothetical protein